MLHAIPWATLRQRDGKYLCQTLDEARVLALTGKFPESKTIDEFLAIGVQSDPGSLLDQGSFPFDKRLSRIIGDLPALPGFTKELSKLGRLSYFNPDRGAFLSLLQKQPAVIRLDNHGFIIKSEEGNGFREGLFLDRCGAENILFARYQNPKTGAAIGLEKTPKISMWRPRRNSRQWLKGQNKKSLARQEDLRGTSCLDRLHSPLKSAPRGLPQSPW